MNWWNFELTMFKLTVHYKHEMRGIWQRFHRNFELTMFELTVPDLYIFTCWYILVNIPLYSLSISVKYMKVEVLDYNLSLITINTVEMVLDCTTTAHLQLVPWEMSISYDILEAGNITYNIYCCGMLEIMYYSTQSRH